MEWQHLKMTCGNMAIEQAEIVPGATRWKLPALSLGHLTSLKKIQFGCEDTLLMDISIIDTILEPIRIYSFTMKSVQFDV